MGWKGNPFNSQLFLSSLTAAPLTHEPFLMDLLMIIDCKTWERSERRNNGEGPRPKKSKNRKVNRWSAKFLWLSLNFQSMAHLLTNWMEEEILFSIINFLTLASLSLLLPSFDFRFIYTSYSLLPLKYIVLVVSRTEEGERNGDNEKERHREKIHLKLHLFSSLSFVTKIRIFPESFLYVCCFVHQFTSLSMP